MKKFIVILMFVFLFSTGCEKMKDKKIDYSEYSFVNTKWTRDSGYDIETIIFKADGGFSYFCACGNPVNDSDLCETYTFDNETKEINLNCFEKTEEMITNIKIIEVSDENLELDFNGEIRKFKKEK